MMRMKQVHKQLRQSKSDFYYFQLNFKAWTALTYADGRDKLQRGHF